ncbi:fibrobacter succinogenes major paralogous domain-containing protein [Fibrobacter intestinalis]|uniref:Major paralogous domain-containing protein n=1 Tax=Fibrobacter intestinalis TaxID=28122 RepID=A0A1T4RU21_9BACT|nr:MULTISPECIES: fibrobacter succinogenes major paralogous domain-containing protein [Fibrobacter]PBC73519.1 uncharacterized protein (TIGR02145 family) [Fibrobacter sp. NR9]SKA19376.1 major paralogous domain-containing protein [Fibrobacter intestinalis]
MKCKQCGEELNEKWTVCPFCGLEISKEQSLGDILLKMIEENGPEIFEEENAGLLKNQMDQWPESFSDDRDVIKLLQIKHIPEQLVKALEMPSEKQAQVLQYATSTLTDKFGINGNMAQKMLALVAGSIGFQINDQVPSIVSIFANADSENTFTDPRDDQVYRTVKIGDQVWMAENLNYAMSGSYCYEKNKENAEKYGRLYIWEAAQKAPPPGWHLPSNEEWNQLFEYVGGTEVAGNQLKSKNGWKDDGNGIDRHGFSVLPAGQVISSDTYLNCGIEAKFWSSTVYGRDKATFWSSAVYGSEYAYSRIFNNNNDGAMADYNSINNGYSVRCIKDSE